MKKTFSIGKGKGFGNQFMARGLIYRGIIRREIINLFSYIKKTITVVGINNLESHIVKTMNINSFIKKEINVTSQIDRVEV